MALSKRATLSSRIRAFAGVVLFLSVLPAVYLLGELRGTQHATGTTDAQETPEVIPARSESAQRLAATEKLNLMKADASKTCGQWQVDPGHAPEPQPSMAGPVAQLQAEMNAMRQRMSTLVGEAPGRMGGLQITEEGDVYIARSSSEGLDQASLRVKVENQQLTVSGEYTRQDGGVSISSSFTRMATLPGPVDPASAKTALKDGSLVVTIDKALPSNTRSFAASGGALLH